MSDDSDIRHSSVSSAEPKKTLSINYNSHTVLKVVVVLLIVVIAFGLGTVYGRHTKSSPTVTTSIRSGGRFGGVGGGFGTVSSVSSSSITLQNARSGSSKTFSITSSTKITENGQSISASSIADGDRAIVTPTSSGGSVAASILVNPSFGGGFGGTGGSSTSGSTTSE